jgi:hypothetical protein
VYPSADGLGYEDLNDHEELRRDPLLAVLVEKGDPVERRGSSKSFRIRRGRVGRGRGGGVAKAEQLEKGANPRFLVKSLSAEQWEARRLYEDLYCARGEMENRIKEQLMLFADRTSTAFLRSNQIRLYFSSAAYLLMQALRRLGLRGTELAQAQCSTLRLKRLKIGAQIRVTVRRVWISLAEGYACRALFVRVYAQLRVLPLRC